ncbi:leucine-rich repeat-containing protein kinase family protein [Zoogloea sp.]|uniref:leucine-rich repeat-containing protein kinase family protein n=1 Tax=Zoogloea sp. TaxID=49181 RepID=UPI0035AFFF6E
MHSLEDLRAGRLKGAWQLRLCAGLGEFPREIFDLADTLEVLDLSGNQLSTLPDDLPRLHRLRILFCSGNLFQVLPEVLGRCPQLEMVGFKSCRIERVPAEALPPRLRWLILTDNRVEALPAAIGRCCRLQKLMLAGNRLRQLPPEMAACTRLELLRVAANQLTGLPSWLLRLPRLAWLAYAGNPFCAAVEQARQVADLTDPVPWHALSVQQVLGEGASGVIHQAAWQDGAYCRDVAVKLFKGAVTSDGLPLNEMAVCLGAGDHPNLIPVLGRIAGHPAEGHGLVMALIDTGFRSLAGPPSFESCTRDVYAPETLFGPGVALRIARGMASVARHLHARGINHGDLYAHNILHCGEGRAVLGDFGAASFHPPGDPGAAEALQRIEVRAFGCLLEELVERSADKPDGGPRTALASLQVRCVDPDPGARPLFAELEQALVRLEEGA